MIARLLLILSLLLPVAAHAQDDDKGCIWLTLDDVVLEWNRSALLRGRVEIEELSAARISVPRLPVAEEDALPPAEAQGFALPELPVSVLINRMAAEEIALGAPVLGQAARLWF